MTNIPADKTAKRTSTSAWLVRTKLVAKSAAAPSSTQMQPPADRIAVRT